MLGSGSPGARADLPKSRRLKERGESHCRRAKRGTRYSDSAGLFRWKFAPIVMCEFLHGRFSWWLLCGRPHNEHRPPAALQHGE